LVSFVSFVFLVVVAVALIGIDRPAAQQRSQAPQRPQAAQQNTEIHVLPVQGNVYMLVGAGGNIAVSVGPDGVLMVDAGLAEASDKVLAAIRTLSDKPVRYIINTHIHADHTGGNPAFGKIVEGGAVGQRGAAEDLQIIAHETVFTRMSAPGNGQPATPFAAWPTIQYPDRKDVYFNDEPIEILHQPAAHTDGDSLVLFRRSDVLATGDIFVTTAYPRIDVERGGTINGIVDGLNHIIEITVPKNLQEGGTQVIPGHGRLGEESDVVEYRDMVTIIRDRVQDMIKKGMSLEQAKAARPTRDYDRRYGATSGPWTTDMFVEAVYRTLVPQRVS
jgi:glyoxylase-like metal-dependent hydrolase (beta-lactamase superfamily II)